MKKRNYEAPEIVEIGGVAERTLGVTNQAAPDGCDCTKIPKPATRD